MDQALNLIGYSKTVKARCFANGELMALIAEAERAGDQTPDGSCSTSWRRRALFSVKAGPKRLTARGA